MSLDQSIKKLTAIFNKTSIIKPEIIVKNNISLVPLFSNLNYVDQEMVLEWAEEEIIQFEDVPEDELVVLYVINELEDL